MDGILLNFWPFTAMTLVGTSQLSKTCTLGQSLGEVVPSNSFLDRDEQGISTSGKLLCLGKKYQKLIFQNCVTVGLIR